MSPGTEEEEGDANRNCWRQTPYIPIRFAVAITPQGLLRQLLAKTRRQSFGDFPKAAHDPVHQSAVQPCSTSP